MKALKIVFILIAIVFVGVFGYYQIKYNSDDISFKNPFESKSFDKYKIEVSEGKTELEKTAIIKYNNMLSTIYDKQVKTKKLNLEDKNEFYKYAYDFLSYISKNEKNISNSLKIEFENKLKLFSSDLDVSENQNINNHNRSIKPQKIEDEVMAPKIEVGDKKKEIEVDLNDYLGSPNDNTDWNYTEIDKEIELHLKEKGVYFSNKKNAWVKIEK